MGCVTSKTDINDHHPNIFEVVNVDGMCNPKKPGQMEVCDTDLVWYERGKPPVIWPLKHLRRYGHDGDLFSFECGRRCPSGPGIYAFKSSRAAQLFKQVQDQTRNNVAEEVLPEFTPRQQAAESNYLEPAPLQLRQNGAVNRFSSHNGRLNSVASSSGPLSPLTLSPSPPPPPPMPPPPPQIPVDDQVLPHSYSNTTSLSCEPTALAMYANIDLTPTSAESVPLPVSQTADGGKEVEEVVEDPPTTPVYMNVTLPPAFVLSDPPPRPVVVEDPDDLDERHSYANLDVGEIEMLKGKERYSAKFQFLSLPTTPPPQQINYIQLDLDQSTSLVLNQPMSPATPTEKSPDRPTAEGYATIDFDRTVALCAVSCERTMQEAADEGCRKTRHDSFMGEENHRSVEVRRTRHNSTISELMAPITSRLSTSFSE